MKLCDYGCGQEAKYKFKNGLWCCSKHYTSCPILKQKNSEANTKRHKFEKEKDIKRKIPLYKKNTHKCKFCKNTFTKNGIIHHEKACYLNPINLTLCPVCNVPIKDYRNTITCSKKCSQIYFKSKFKKANKNRDMGWVEKLYGKYKGPSFLSICFKYHKRKCIICGEDIVVAVHHYDGNHDNNNPENLVPLCPTHHVYT